MKMEIRIAPENYRDENDLVISLIQFFELSPFGPGTARLHNLRKPVPMNFGIT